MAADTSEQRQINQNNNNRRNIMIKVKLLQTTEGDPMALASHAALMCYQAEPPKMGELIDVKGRLFNPGHHTTLEHFNLTFQIEGTPINDVTLGLHLTHPFYNTDQRSGRYCATMFLNPNYSDMQAHINELWPDMGEDKIQLVMNFIEKGVGIYQKNIGRATDAAAKLLKEERSCASKGSIEANKGKIAQEQLRMFISTIFPTGLDETQDLITLASEFETPWTPGMRYIVNKKVEAAKNKLKMSYRSKLINLFIDAFPKLAKKYKLIRRQDISFMFNPDKQRKDDWSITIAAGTIPKISYSPSLELLGISGDLGKVVSVKAAAKDPVDKLHFKPETMSNSVIHIRTKKCISLATMGQDQRHRTLQRGIPAFTGKFYMPPILQELHLESEALEIMKHWIYLVDKIPGSLWMAIAPYGAMVEYESIGSVNAIAHEQGKRTCWCAQEEIYWLAVLLRKAIEQKLTQSKDENELKSLRILLSIFEPACYSTGVCIEGPRCCGRQDMALVVRNSKMDYFRKRKV